MKLILKIAVLIFVMVASGLAVAQDIGLNAFMGNMGSFGALMNFNQNSKPAVLTEIFDVQKMTKLIPTFQSMGLMNPDISQTAMNIMPVTLNGVVAVEMTSSTTLVIYQKTPIDLLHINAFMRIVDDYGRQKDVPIFSCRFTRALYKKIDWNHFNSASFPKVAASFKYSPWYMMKVRSEMQLN